MTRRRPRLLPQGRPSSPVGPGGGTVFVPECAVAVWCGPSARASNLAACSTRCAGRPRPGRSCVGRGSVATKASCAALWRASATPAGRRQQSCCPEQQRRCTCRRRIPVKPVWPRTRGGTIDRVDAPGPDSQDPTPGATQSCRLAAPFPRRPAQQGAQAARRWPDTASACDARASRRHPRPRGARGAPRGPPERARSCRVDLRAPLAPRHGIRRSRGPPPAQEERNPRFVHDGRVGRRVHQQGGAPVVPYAVLPGERHPDHPALHREPRRVHPGMHAFQLRQLQGVHGHVPRVRAAAPRARIPRRTRSQLEHVRST